MSIPTTLRFGIQSLDKLIGSVKVEGEAKMHYGVDLTQSDEKRQDEVATSICLAGPHGTGKSVFCLHMASQYWADCLEGSATATKSLYPKVFYISTDLSYALARKGWNEFRLKQPFKRSEPLIELKAGRKGYGDESIEIELKQYLPSADSTSNKSIIHYLECSCEKPGPEVCFIDLASRTAGDDWGFLHRVLSGLEEPEKNAPRHLVLIDAVEGFETLVGGVNAFGEESSRRSRIAQVMRLVAEKCHLVLVVEERREERLPEEFVTDVVIRLRSIQTGRYLRRTVEIEKTRGQLHVRGQHPYVIRDGAGSTTGDQNNSDDPRVNIDPPGKFQSYIHVFPSLNHISRDIMIDEYSPRKQPPGDRFAAFGIPYLDNMLGGEGEKAERHKAQDYDTRGLFCGSATALLGDSLTQKSQLGKAFLSRAFYSDARAVSEVIRQAASGDDTTTIQQQVELGIQRIANGKDSADKLATVIVELIRNRTNQLRRDVKQSQKYHAVVVLFTTQDLNRHSLADELFRWLRDDESILAPGMFLANSQDQSRETEENANQDDLTRQIATRIGAFAQDFKEFADKYKAKLCSETFATFSKLQKYKRATTQFKEWLINSAIEHGLKDHIREHIICRRFEIHDLPAPVLMNIFERNIEKAQRKMLGLEDPCRSLPEAERRFRDSWRIRVVIDDLNVFRNTYPEVSDDPLMLPSLLFMLQREGVTSLIVDTQSSGDPSLSIRERFDSSIRELVRTCIYTWRLPFYGEHRVAICLIPPISHEYRGLIRELRWETSDESKLDRSLTVDPHFELYMGLEKTLPQSVPLEVRLFAETPSVENYIQIEEKLLKGIFTPVPKKNGEARVIIATPVNEYEALRDVCHLQRDTRLDHTTILQVNEFWWLRRSRQRRAGAFRPQWNYLSAATSTLKGNRYHSDVVVDPFLVFQPPAIKQEPVRKGGPKKTGELLDKDKVKRRRDFFDVECGYDLLKVDGDEEAFVDRVPYTWDFGFLLCNGKAWDEAAAALENNNNQIPATETNVKEVWDNLSKAAEDNGQLNDEPSSSKKYVSWHRFLEASRYVAEFQSFRRAAAATAFDFTMLIPESFSCLILEMWLSESYDSLTRYVAKNSNSPEELRAFERQRKHLREVGRRRWSSETRNPVTLLGGLGDKKGQSLEAILDARKEKNEILGFSLELYKVWLLLTEAINFPDLVDSSSHLNFEFRSRDVNPHAVSARHWYKTASKFMDSLTSEQVEYNWVPVRLPGHFSVRADWFLAVAGGSRSSRLADHALDLLSSQRSNITRLQEGIGLPTRRLFDRNDSTHLRTRLISAERGKALTNVEYELLRQIGAGLDPENKEEFFWLWRSRIWAYNRHSRIWHKWLNRTLLAWHSWHQRYSSNWKNGFYIYKLLSRIEFEDDKEADNEFKKLRLESWKEFHKLRDILIAELDQVSIAAV